MRLSAVTVPVCVLLLTHFARAAAPATQPDVLAPPGRSEIVRLWPGDAPATGPADPEDGFIRRGKTAVTGYGVSKVVRASLGVFLPAHANGPTPAAILCPGGGYVYESVKSEGNDVAAKLADNGIAAFVLKYRLPDGHPPAEGQLPVPQQDVLRAIQLVRSQAAHWNLDPAKIGVIGFSAGGHLAATAATLYDQADTFAAKAGRDAVSRVSARPDFAVLMYPVITMDRAASHGGSRKSLLGENPDAALEARFSADLHVTAKTPPLLIVHAKDDKSVPVVNSQRMSDAAEKAGVPHKLVLYEKGGHGFGLGNNNETRMWFSTCLGWLREQGVIEVQP